MEEIRIYGIHIPEREKASVEVQDILTRYGCSVKTRLGLHLSTEDGKSQGGLLILELCGTREESDRLKQALQQIDGITLKSMEFPFR